MFSHFNHVPVRGEEPPNPAKNNDYINNSNSNNGMENNCSIFRIHTVYPYVEGFVFLSDVNEFVSSRPLRMSGSGMLRLKKTVQ